MWAIGDCASSGCPPTAQAAAQQGKYLGRLFRESKLKPEAIDSFPAFKFAYRGSLAFLGDGKGVAEIRGIWDHYPGSKSLVIEGAGAFAIWRSLYFSKLMSGRNQAQVAFDWTKTFVFGRDIATPHVMDEVTASHCIIS